MGYCIKNMMERQQKSAKEAEELIRKTNKYRRDYYRYYIGGEWDAICEYDLSINTAAVGEDYAVKMIIDLLKQKGMIEGN